jgi:AcrR family transcriptional regulator
MARSAEQTRRKLFDASVAEFATYGISGARVDRITASAGVNNALLYRYFGSKSDLFDTVFGTLATKLIDAVPFSPDELPAYAGALVDYYAAHPEVVRLAAWHQLEPGDRPLPESIRKSLQEKIARIEEAQAAGRLTNTFPAAALLNVVLSVANTATDAAALQREYRGRVPVTEHRRMVIAAVAGVLSGCRRPGSASILKRRR